MNHIHVAYRNLNDVTNLNDKDDELILEKTIKYLYFSKKKEKRNKSRENKIEEYYFIKPGYNDTYNLKKLNKYLNF